MSDEKTLRIWRSEFVIFAAFRGVDVACTIDSKGGRVVWHSKAAAEGWHFYRIARQHERCAAACALAQQRIDAVVSSTDWQSVNAIARNSE